jgi:hypothetical protein
MAHHCPAWLWSEDLTHAHPGSWPLAFGAGAGVNPTKLTEVEEDVANFLLIRGKYAYLGNGWTGCGHFYEYPAEQFNADYGEPLGMAKETAADSGIFVREWSKATIKMDCNSYTPTITFK